MTDKTANASTLGYAGFALTLWMVSMLNAGWFGAAPAHMDMLLAFTFGGAVMALAGLMEFFRGRTIEMLMFLGFSAFWWTWAMHAHASSSDMMRDNAGGYMGWYFLVWAVFAFWIWMGSMHAGTMRNLFMLGLWLSLLALAIADWSGSNGFTMLGGYLGLITALIGGYISAAETVNAGAGHTVLALGDHHDSHDAHGTVAHA